MNLAKGRSSDEDKKMNFVKDYIWHFSVFVGLLVALVFVGAAVSHSTGVIVLDVHSMGLIVWGVLAVPLFVLYVKKDLKRCMLYSFPSPLPRILAKLTVCLLLTGIMATVGEPLARTVLILFAGGALFSVFVLSEVVEFIAKLVWLRRKMKVAQMDDFLDSQ